jgi:uncharacterized protein (DUF1697 family)
VAVFALLLRGANVGGKRFSAKAVEKALAGLGCVSLGAAGTFVFRKGTEAAARKRLAAELPFACAILAATAEQVEAALKAGAKLDDAEAVRKFATFLAAPATLKLPLEAPPGAGWGVRVLAAAGPILVGVRKRVDATGVYPNEVVEKATGQQTTTRDWPTLEKLAKLLAA